MFVSPSSPDRGNPAAAKFHAKEIQREVQHDQLAQVLNGAEDSRGFGVFAAFNVPMGDGGGVAWSAAAPRR
jgi:hypothetical protein